MLGIAKFIEIAAEIATKVGLEKFGEKFHGLSSITHIKKKLPDPHLIRDFICYNQGKYAQYNFIVSRRHRDLKNEMLKNPSSKKRINECVKRLEDYAYMEMENAYLESYKMIKQFFDSRAKHKVRICVKAQNKEGAIVDLFRDNRAYFGKSYSIDSNTGFKQVFDSGKPYICNNIPDAAKKGKYINPRLVPVKVANYALTRKEKKEIHKNHKDDEKWIACWEPLVRSRDGSQLNLTSETCYKSTLIVPMTLIGNTLEIEFRNHFNISGNADNRGIFGYLCFDNHTEQYFNETNDEHIGYIFADILSLYLITELTYTKYSEKYREAKSLLL